VGASCQALLCVGGEAKDCDDGEACTADGCQPDTGLCQHVGLIGPCDDGESCTSADACAGLACVGAPLDCDDLCEAGQCLHRVTSCQQDADCYDGEALCSLDRCVAGACAYQATGQPGCCVGLPWRVDFAGGALGELSLVSSLGPGQGFRAWPGATPPGSLAADVLYYGDPAKQSYDLHPDGHGGSALRAKIALPPGRPARLRARLWLDVERAALYDELTLRVRHGGAEHLLWQKGPKTPTQAWFELDLPLVGAAGRMLEVELRFRTIDGIENGGLGVLVDALEVVVDCGG
jgi:hypothetical protein